MPLIQETGVIRDSSLLFQTENNLDNKTSKANPGTHDVSPKHKANLGLHNVNDSEFTSQHSPLQLSSMLNSMSLNNENQKVPRKPTFNGPFILLLKNVPKDITLRECHAIFALANNTSNIELIKPEHSEKEDPFVKVFIDSFITATGYAMILNSKPDIFGPEYPLKSYVELIDQPTNQHISFNEFMQSSESYRLGSDLNNMHNFQNIVTSTTPNIASVFDASSFPKKSRFSFSDNFSNDSNLMSNSNENQGISNGTLINSQVSQAVPNHNQSFQDLSTSNSVPQGNAGKSILMMESDDYNDTIWGSNGISFNVNDIQNSSNQPAPMFEWNAGGSRKQSNTFGSFHQTVGNMPSQSVPGSSTQLSNIATEGFLQPGGNLSSFGMPPSVSSPNQQMLSQLDPVLPSNQQHQNIIPQTSAFHVNEKLAAENQSSKSQSSAPQKIQSIRSTRTSQGIVGLQKNQSTTSLPYTNSNSGTISQADLSLLAKVPPPANPADQNPPCNTLYVGNLPSDATEQELRQLFSSQQGFRRLSFRNKNSNGNGHGPICFVEFDDVSFATRALAELYGSQLPSATVSNKGGIRLSFSKNPLGVRGPNNRKNTSSPTINGSSSSNSYSYIGNYGK